MRQFPQTNLGVSRKKISQNNILRLDKVLLMCYYTNEKRGRKATSRNVEAKTVATVDNLHYCSDIITANREPSGSDRRLTFSFYRAGKA